MIVDRARWTSFFDGYAAVDCAVMDPARIFFVLDPDGGDGAEDAGTRLLFARLGRAMDDRRFVVNRPGFAVSGIAFGPERTEFVATSLAGDVFRYDAATAVVESGIPRRIPGSDLGAVVHGVTRVGGALYAFGWPHRVWRRNGPDAWTPLAAGLPAPPSLQTSAQQVEAIYSRRFRAVAGFGADDLYAVGDAGEVWHWSGARWTRRPFPSDEPLVAACAAGGRLFVAGQSGTLWAGRQARWTSVHDSAPYPFEDLAWFADRLWCGASNGALHVLEGDRLVSAGAPAAVSPGINHLDVAPDGSGLVVAGRGGAALHDGATWRVLFGATAPRERQR